MHYGSPYSRLVAALIGAILVSVAPGLEAAAQKSKKGSSQTAPSNPLLWENPRTIVQVKKPGHRTRPGRPRRERKPYLAVRLRLLILGEDGKENPTSPETVFHPGDRLRLAVKANQDGYLYIIYRAAPDQDGERLYPDSRVDYGQNFFRKNQEVTVPTTCRGNISPCAYVVTPVNVKE